MTARRHLQRASTARQETLEERTCESDQPSASGLNVGVVFQASDSYCEFSSDLPSALAGQPTDSEEGGSENSSIASEIPSDTESFMEMSSDGNASSDNISDGEEQNDSDRDEGEEEDLEQFLYDIVLRLVEIKGKAGFSQSVFEELLHWGEDIINKANSNLHAVWPSCWADVLSLLEKVGYSNPRLYWVCLDDSHPFLFGLLSSKDENCPHCGKKGKIPYYYLSVIDYVFQ